MTKSSTSESGPLVRAARARDIPLLANTILRASSQPFDQSPWEAHVAKTRSSAQQFLCVALRANAMAWGEVRDFILLEDGGTHIGACAIVTFPSEKFCHTPFQLDKLEDVARVLSWDATEVRAFREDYASTWGEMDFDHPSKSIIEWFSVAPAQTGKGHGKRLLEAAFQEAVKRGITEIGLTVIHGNNAAKALYEVYFQPLVSYYPAYFGDAFPGLTKMVKRLDA